jgi:hypothetical protein
LVLTFLQDGINDKQAHDNARTILLKMGEFFQIQVGLSSFKVM